MLFPKRFWPGIADGSVTLTFRRWRRQQVLAGRRYRTPAGIVEVTSVTIASPDEIRDDEARAGHRDAASLVAELPDRPDSDLFRIEFHAVTEPDPEPSWRHRPTSTKARLRRSPVAWTGSTGQAATDRGPARPLP